MVRDLKLVVEGWRTLSHSYALVHQWSLLALARRAGIDLRVRDLPTPNPAWRPQPGLFPPPHDQVLRALARAPADFRPDVTWRTAFPYDLTPAPNGRTVVFGTAEHRVVPRAFLAGIPLSEALADSRLTIATPSCWSAEGFRRMGFDESRVAVIPHGIDPTVFRPRSENRDAARQGLGLTGFVFMSAGAMTRNKGIDILLKAFAAVAERQSHARLLLKGADGLYPSAQYVRAALDGLPRSSAERIAQRLVYCGEALTMAQMADLYQAADAYVTPYRAEGFNLPALEAAACGLPLICTRGGPTDEFTTDAFALGIDAVARPETIAGEPGEALEPDLDHLVALMLRVIDDDVFRARARQAGPRHACDHFTWDQAIERALPLMKTVGAA